VEVKVREAMVRDRREAKFHNGIQCLRRRRRKRRRRKRRRRRRRRRRGGGEEKEEEEVILAKIRPKFEAFGVMRTLETPQEMYLFYVYAHACVCVGRRGCSSNPGLFYTIVYKFLRGSCMNRSPKSRIYA